MQKNYEKQKTNQSDVIFNEKRVNMFEDLETPK